MIYMTSDLHFCHDKDFLYERRGFVSIDEMNETIVHNWNIIVEPEDEVYILGDLMLKDNEKGIELLKRLNGQLHIILGNHDTKKRIPLYEACENVVEVTYAKPFRYKGYHFFLTHYPTYTANIDKESIHQTVINLHGHTHQKNPFFQDHWFMYNVSMDAHDCKPIAMPQIIKEITEKLLATDNKSNLEN